MYYIGIDIGGMSIKAGITDATGAIYAKKTFVTEPHKPANEIIDDIITLIKSIISEFGCEKSEIGGIGIGIPGSVCDEIGLIRYTCNINFADTPIAAPVEAATGIKTHISNDANCAALAETLFGAGKGAKNSVMVTLGTGVGTGIIVDGKLLKGNRSAGAEGGHMKINFSGPICGCGKKGCFEAYASATALIRQTALACQRHPTSLLAQTADKSGINGKTVFIAAKAGDKTAKSVISKYLRYVGIGLVNFANIFYPEVLIIGGGISNEGDAIIAPLQKYVSKNAYGTRFNPPVRVVAATLKNDAGIIGAAALCL